MSSQLSFQRSFKLRHILAIAIGGTISSTYFLGNGYLISQLGPLTFLVFIFGGFLTYITMGCFAELCGGEHPSHHSFIGYAKKYISPSWACGVGWAYWVNWVIYIPAECMAGGILMNVFVPQVNVYIWATLFGIFITYINIRHVTFFREMAFWLTFTHIALFVGFSVLAVLIFFNWIGTPHEFIGSKFILSKEGLLPNGVGVFFINMAILFLNFQGAEIIGLSASESHEAKKTIPMALKEIGLSVSILYTIPIFLLALIFPWQKANLTGSVFSTALESYGLTTFASIFSFLVICGSLSCANSGLYASARTMHTLATLKMAPKAFEKLNNQGVPARGAFFTFSVIWIIFVISYFFPSQQVYMNLLGLAGLTGSFAWISICWSQYRFRKSKEPSRVKIKGFPYLTLFGLWAQVLSLLAMIFSGDMRPAFYISIPALIIPMLIYKKIQK